MFGTDTPYQEIMVNTYFAFYKILFVQNAYCRMGRKVMLKEKDTHNTPW